MLNNRLEPYFPTSFRWLGFILIPLGVVSIFPAQGFPGLLWPVLAIVAGVISIWTFYGSQIDFEQRLVREYVGIFGLKWGKWGNLPQLEKVFVTKSNYSQVIWSRVSNTQQQSSVFSAYLKGREDFKFLFCENKKKEPTMAEARAVSNKLDIQVLDCTVNPPVWLNSTIQHEA